MLKVYQNDRLDRLLRVFEARSHESVQLGNLPAARTVIVPHRGIGEWLKLEIASRYGVSARLDCVLPASFMWRLYRYVLGETVPESSPYAREAMAWHIFGLLPGLQRQRGFEPVQAYLAGDGDPELRRFQLSSRIADLFDRYLVYRQDWIRSWDAGDGEPESRDEAWQRDLWRALTREIRREAGGRGLHRAEIHERFIAALTDMTTWPADLPSRVHIFGVSHLPEFLLDGFVRISRLEGVTVDLYMVNPCRQFYWGDIRSGREIARQQSSTSAVEGAEMGHPLLASLGIEARRFIEQLLAYDDIDLDEGEYGEDRDRPATLLGRLQQDVADMTVAGRSESDPDFGLTKTTREPDDRSLQLHACHSAYREVEVLYDEVVQMMRRDPGLMPRDFLVMAPDINDYAPYIEAVFNTATDYQEPIPFNIADRSLVDRSPLFRSFLQLVSLPNSRFEVDAIVDLLGVQPIAATFGMSDPETIAAVKQWITASGVRWGIDGAAKGGLGLPPEHTHTWRFGLERLLMGYATGGLDVDVDGILPLDVFEASDDSALGDLITFIEALRALEEELSVPKTAVAWQACLLDVMTAFYGGSRDADAELDAMRVIVAEVLDTARTLSPTATLGHALVTHLLRTRLAVRGVSPGFLGRGISFCSLVPSRCIPARVVCLIGMNDREYPRPDTPLGFDLIRRDGQRLGDRSSRHEERYLFLESLLSAEDAMHISFVGRSIRDNGPRPPSVLVGELLDCCDRTFGADGEETRDALVEEHPLQPHSLRYYRDGSRLETSSREGYDAWTTAPLEPGGRAAFRAPEPQMVPDHVELAQLVRFYRHPARFFFNEILRVYLTRPEDSLVNVEPFEMGGLARYRVLDDALSRWREDGYEADVRSLLRTAPLSGEVMPGPLGDLQVQDLGTQLGELIAAVKPHVGAEEARVAIDLEFDRVRLTGEIGGIFGGDRVLWRVGKVRTADMLDLWIGHLGLCASGLSLESHHFGIPAGEACAFDGVPQDAAFDELGRLVELYRRGHRELVPLIPDVSLATRKGGGEEGIEKAAAAWRSHKAYEDPYYQRAFSIPADLDAEFVRVAASVFDPLLEAGGA